MSYCTHEAERIPCPEACKDTSEHTHWRCPEGHGWIRFLDGVDWFDLSQPARLIYPVYPKATR